jgi:hypothetical protein
MEGDECRRPVRRELPATPRIPPLPQQTSAHIVPARDIDEPHTRLLEFRKDPKLVLQPPAPPTLNAGDDLHPATLPPLLPALQRTPVEAEDRSRTSSEGGLHRRVTNNAPAEFAFSYAIDANRSLTFTLHEVYLALAKTPVEGPGGVEVTFEFRAAYNAAATRMMSAVLRNQQAGTEYA